MKTIESKLTETSLGPQPSLDTELVEEFERKWFD